MFVRVKRSDHNGRSYEYLQIVESVRKGKNVRQRLIANLGRVNELISEGELDNFIRSMTKFSERLRVMDAAQAPDIDSCRAKLWGPALVFGRLWEKQGIPPLLGDLASGHRFRFNPERATFALALQRLCRPGSDL